MYRRFSNWFSRVYDHSYRKIRGVPQVHRSQIRPNVYLGGQYYRLGLRQFKKWGVTGVISMRLTPPLGFTKVAWLEVLHLPTPDQQAPSIEQLNTGVEFIHRHLDLGGSVYIHCRYGEGRGPTMVIAYLMSTGVSFTQAKKEVQAVRPFIRLTPPQKAVLTSFSSKSHIILPSSS
jgi:protein-tyrosine phosphatase